MTYTECPTCGAAPDQPCTYAVGDGSSDDLWGLTRTAAGPHRARVLLEKHP